MGRGLKAAASIAGITCLQMVPPPLHVPPSPPCQGTGDGINATCSHVYSKFALVRRGLYAYQLEVWLKHFSPEQLMVINQDEV